MTVQRVDGPRLIYLFGTMDSPGDGQWGRLHNSVNVHSGPELWLRVSEDGPFYVYFAHNLRNVFTCEYARVCRRGTRAHVLFYLVCVPSVPRRLPPFLGRTLQFRLVVLRPRWAVRSL